MSEVMTAKADTIDGNLEHLLAIASKVAELDTGLGIELHCLYVDLSEGITDLEQNLR